MIEVVAICVALFCVFPLAIYKYLTWNQNFWKRRGIIGPKPQLLVGSFPSLLNGKHHIVYDFDEIYCLDTIMFPLTDLQDSEGSWVFRDKIFSQDRRKIFFSFEAFRWTELNPSSEFKNKAKVVGVFMGRNPELLAMDPNIATEVMVSSFRSFRDNMASKFVQNPKKDKFASRNPFFSLGDKWKLRRTETLGGITVNKLTASYPIFKEVAIKLRKYLKEQTKDGPVEIDTKDLAQRFTTAVMADFLWGIDSRSFSTDPNNQSPIQDMGKRMLLNSFGAVSLYFQLSVVPFLKRFFGVRFFPKETDAFFSMLTEEAIRLRLSHKNKDRVDYLNYVMQLQEKKDLSHDDIMGHTLTVFLDGYETAAHLIYHTLFYLAKNITAQERLRAEIHDNLHRREFLLFDELNSLPFLDQCVHETIRLVTPIPIFSRICTEKAELEVEEGKFVTVSPGQIVTIPVFSYHHDKEYFPEPYKYKPERFDYQPHSNLTKKGIFMPFGEGPRTCLGMRMGLFEIKTCIVEMIKNFKVSSGPRTMEEKRPDAESFILGLDGDFWLKCEPL